MPTYVVVDMSWLYMYEDNHYWLYQRMPIRKIIEILTTVPYYATHYMEFFWEEFYRQYDDSHITTVMQKSAQLTVETLITEFYRYLEMLVGGVEDQYIFFGWINNDAMMMVKQNYYKRLLPPPCLKRYADDRYYNQFIT